MITDQTFTLERAQSSDYIGLEQLLTSVRLPVEDLPADLTHFVVAKQESRIIGSGGLEIMGSYALLRSLAVDVTWQGKGVGFALYQILVSLAQENNVDYLYLITTTADHYFEKLGFNSVDRVHVPDVIRQTSQFSSVCLSSAVVMMKKV